MKKNDRAFRWGILGTSIIVDKFVLQLMQIENVELYSIASRSKERAQMFAEKYDITKSFGSYEEMLNDQSIDAVYIATASHLHYKHCLMCLEANIPILCEKPFTTNAQDAEAIAQVAGEKGIFCMEGMWMRFNPVIQHARQLIQSGSIGDINYVNIEVGYRKSEERLLDPSLGRGSMLDFGVYGLSLSYYFFGPPDKVISSATLYSSGVDETSSVTLQYPDKLIHISASVRTQMSNEAIFWGSLGRLKVSAPFYNPLDLQIFDSKSSSKKGKVKRLINRYIVIIKNLIAEIKRQRLVNRKDRAIGLREEAITLMHSVRKGETESHIMPLSETVAILATIDQLRESWKHRCSSPTI